MESDFSSTLTPFLTNIGGLSPSLGGLGLSPKLGGGLGPSRRDRKLRPWLNTVSTSTAQTSNCIPLRLCISTLTLCLNTRLHDCLNTRQRHPIRPYFSTFGSWLLEREGAGMVWAVADRIPLSMLGVLVQWSHLTQPLHVNESCLMSTTNNTLAGIIGGAGYRSEGQPLWRDRGRGGGYWRIQTSLGRW